MELYPEVLISHRAYPNLDEKVVASCFFIRRTNENIYPLIEQYKPLELLDKILPNTTKRDVFVLSVSLYGYFDECHILFKATDNSLNQYWERTMPDIQASQIAYSIETGYPLYLHARKLYKIDFEFENEHFHLSFCHKPTIVNYWHFQLFTCDSKGQHLPREPEPGVKETKAEAKRLRRLATLILEYLISESICSGSEAKKFQYGEL